VEEGLSQSQVTSILQDDRGHLWVGTHGGGVCKFDGVNFFNYSEKNGLSGNIVTDLCADKAGNIWITSSWGGVSKYNGRKFLNYTTKDGLLDNKNNKVVFSDSKNNIWIGGKAGVVVNKNGIFTSLTLENKKIIGNNIQEIIEDSKGNIWIGTATGITVINDNKTIHLSKKNGLTSPNTKAILEDIDGNYLIGTDKGILKILAGSLYHKTIEFDNTLFHGIDTIITDLLLDKENNIWISTNGDGVYLLNDMGKIAHINKRNGLITNKINTIYSDHSGNIWMGTNGAGLIKYSHKAFTNFSKEKGLNSPLIFNITEDLNNNIWAGTSDEGVYKYDGNSATQYTTKDGLGSNTIRATLTEPNGTLWFATSNGLSRYKNGAFKTFTIKDGLTSNNLSNLLLDQEGNLWIGTYDRGIIKYNHKKFTSFTKKEGLSHLVIHSLFEDSKGNIWIGAQNGVNKYANGKITSFANSKEFCQSHIRCIAEDRHGNIWFGTDRCAVKYDGLEFKKITPNDKVYSGIIYLMYSDSKGYLWIGTNNGINRITFDSYGEISRVKNYKSKQGFKGVECNSRAIFEDRKNNLWIGTVKGLIKFDPTEDKTNVFEPNIQINNLQLSFEDVDWRNYSEKLTKWNNLPEDLVLDYNQNHLTFEFSAINLTFPEDVEYRFRLIPLDKKWYSPTNKNTVTYSNLPPGDYTFKVKARNEDGVWNQEPAFYHFTITRPWFKSWWFILIMISIVFYGIYKISSFREIQQRKVSKELEEKVKERTTLIKMQRDEKEILLKEIHHRVKNNMQVIISLISIQSGYTQDKVALALFEEAKNRIRSMALIHEKMYQTGDLTLIDIQDYIIVLTNDLIDTYSINCDIFLDIKIHKTKFTIDTLIPLGLLLNEIISNALKYAFKGSPTGKMTIHLSLDEKENIYTLLIGDNGIGMPFGTLEKEDGSLGMELVKIFVTQLDGEIKRLEDKGTFYEIKFPPRG
jgi:two-component sensor histidine kinase/ligand-binding sensor domain-containing protein